MSVLPKRLFHWSTLFAKLNLIKMKDMKKFYFLILGIVLCGMVAQAQIHTKVISASDNTMWSRKEGS